MYYLILVLILNSYRIYLFCLKRVLISLKLFFNRGLFQNAFQNYFARVSVIEYISFLFEKSFDFIETFFLWRIISPPFQDYFAHVSVIFKKMCIASPHFRPRILLLIIHVTRIIVRTFFFFDVDLVSGSPIFLTG